MMEVLLHREAQDGVISSLHYSTPIRIKCTFLKFSLITGKFKIDS